MNQRMSERKIQSSIYRIEGGSYCRVPISQNDPLIQLANSKHKELPFTRCHQIYRDNQYSYFNQIQDKYRSVSLNEKLVTSNHTNQKSSITKNTLSNQKMIQSQIFSQNDNQIHKNPNKCFKDDSNYKIRQRLESQKRSLFINNQSEDLKQQFRNPEQIQSFETPIKQSRQIMSFEQIAGKKQTEKSIDLNQREDNQSDILAKIKNQKELKRSHSTLNGNFNFFTQKKSQNTDKLPQNISEVYCLNNKTHTILRLSCNESYKSNKNQPYSNIQKQSKKQSRFVNMNKNTIQLNNNRIKTETYLKGDNSQTIPSNQPLKKTLIDKIQSNQQIYHKNNKGQGAISYYLEKLKAIDKKEQKIGDSKQQILKNIQPIPLYNPIYYHNTNNHRSSESKDYSNNICQSNNNDQITFYKNQLNKSRLRQKQLQRIIAQQKNHNSNLQRQLFNSLKSNNTEQNKQQIHKKAVKQFKLQCGGNSAIIYFTFLLIMLIKEMSNQKNNKQK